MTSGSIPVHFELEEELENLDITPAKHSTTDYYNTWKSDSYPLNLESDKRARAVMFTMTARRRGWKEDVRGGPFDTWGGGYGFSFAIKLFFRLPV